MTLIPRRGIEAVFDDLCHDTDTRQPPAATWVICSPVTMGTFGAQDFSICQPCPRRDFPEHAASTGLLAGAAGLLYT